MNAKRYFTLSALLWSVFVVILLLLFGWVGKQESDMAADDNKMYCDMVKLYESSNGANGWPNFKKEDCK